MRFALSIDQNAEQKREYEEAQGMLLLSRGPKCHSWVLMKMDEK